MKQLALPLIASLFYCQNALAEQTQRVDIPSQPLAKALEQFEQQTGVQILYAAEATSGKTSPHIAGNYTPEQALKILLDKSGLAYRFTDDHTVVVKRVDPAPAPIIRLADSSLNSLALGGVFDSNDLERFLTTLEAVLPVEVKRDNNGDVLINREKIL